MTRLDFQPFDADNHYYEAEDAFTRYADPAMANRTMQWAEIHGKRRLLVASQIQRFIANPTFDPVAKPGSLQEWFKGTSGATNIRDAFGELEPLPAEYRDRDARIAKLDEQGMEGAILFPTLGVGMENMLLPDIEAVQHALSAFNKWLEDDWGYAYQDRIFAAAMISLSDPEGAVEELDRVLAKGARVVCLKMGPVRTAVGFRSPGDEMFDAFWDRIDRAGVTVGFHTGDAGYTRYTDEFEPFGDFRSFQFTPFRLLTGSRAIYDTMAALLCHGVYDRFPNVRVASVENGSTWVPELFVQLKKVCKSYGHLFNGDPIETFKRHVWVSPFNEEDVPAFVRLVGADRTLFGSDFPHAEGLENPVDYVEEIAEFDDESIRKIMRDNARDLVTPRPLAAPLSSASVGARA